jgi:hypothetical protein
VDWSVNQQSEQSIVDYFAFEKSHALTDSFRANQITLFKIQGAEKNEPLMFKSTFKKKILHVI